MNFKPILFSTPMVQAILEDRKTQTRRIIKPQPVARNNGMYTYQNKKGSVVGNVENISDEFLGIGSMGPIKQGDILWVRETYTVFEPEHCEGMSERFYYKASHHPTNEEWRLECIEDGYPYKWKPSIFMPKAACRIFLEVTNVRVERLQDISEEDAIAEGVEIGSSSNGAIYRDYLATDRSDLFEWFSNAIFSFESLWQSINGPDSWDANPWVWVYDFKRIEKPENFKY